jgi:MFS family permease
MNEELGPSESYLWIPLSYTLCSAVSFTLCGRLSDIFGRRWFFIGGNMLGLVGGIVAATAQSIGALIASNVLLGLGGPIQLSYAITLPELVPFKYRGLTNAYVLSFTIPGAAFGPVIAKSFIANTSSGWRWSYYLNIITTVIALGFTVAFYHPPSFSMLHMGKTRWEKVKALDFGGIVLFTAGLAIFLLGINWGGGLYSWQSTHVVSCIVVGAMTLAALVFYEAYVPSDPLIPVSLLKNLQFMLYVAVACVGGMIYYSLGVMWPLIVSDLFTTDLVYQGWLSMSTAGGNTLGNVCCGLAFVYIGRIKYQLIIAATIMTALVGSLSSTTQHTQTQSVIISVIGTFFAGFVEGIPNIAAPYTTKPEDIGLAIGVLSAIRNSFGGVAVAIYTAILSSKSASLSAKYIPKAVLDAGLPASSLTALFEAIAAGTSTALSSVPGMSIEVESALTSAQKDAFSGATKIVFLVTISFGSLGVVATLFTNNIEHLMTDEVVR